MEKARTFKLRLFEGMQTVRLDEDSLDYDWKGLGKTFHGTLPYENLRLKKQVTRKGREWGLVVLIVGWIFISLLFLLRPPAGEVVVRVTGLILVIVTGAFTRQLLSPGAICVQIEPRAFGFGDQLPVPDNKGGRAFLAELEEAWRASLRRRFLIHDDSWPRRIDWLESIGVLDAEQAAGERAIFEGDDSNERKLIGALN